MINFNSIKKVLVLMLLVLICADDLSARKRRRRRYRTTWNNAMDRFELIGGTGFTQFMGELGGADNIGTNFLADFDFDALRPNIHLGFRYRYNEFLASRISLTYG